MRELPNPNPFLILTQMRTGGTLLCHLLDAHPRISCCRSEPLHGKGMLVKGGWGVEDVARLWWEDLAQGVDAAGFKVSYCQIEHQLASFDSLLREWHPKIIVLTRNDVLLQAISQILMTDDTRPIHLYQEEGWPAEGITLDPDRVVAQTVWVANRRTIILRLAEQYASEVAHSLVYWITYERLAKSNQLIPDVIDNYYLIDDVFNFLGVEAIKVTCQLKPVNAGVEQHITNWDEIEQRATEALEGIGHE